jgi:NADH dehydrogenase
MCALGVSAEHAPLTRYWGSKYAGKQAVTSSGLDWTVLEPSFVFGRGGGALKAFESLIRMPLAPVIGDGRYRHQPVWAGDVARRPGRRYRWAGRRCSRSTSCWTSWPG